MGFGINKSPKSLNEENPPFFTASSTPKDVKDMVEERQGNKNKRTDEFIQPIDRPIGARYIKTQGAEVRVYVGIRDGNMLPCPDVQAHRIRKG